MAFEPRSALPAHGGEVAIETPTPFALPADLGAPSPRLLRLGQLSMDTRTGVARWQGAVLSLSADERRLLAELVRHAGQILTVEYLATALDLRRDAVEARMRSLTQALRVQGVRLHPRAVSGCGYVLWR